MRLRSITRRFLLNYYGYVKLPLIPLETVNALINYYNEKAIGFNSGIFNSVLIPDKTIRIEHDLIIRSILNDYLEQQIEDFKVIIAIFFSKSINGAVNIGTHQDPTFVDTEIHDDFTIWIPLVDTNKENTGRLKFFKKSHRKYARVTLPIPAFYYEYPNEKLISINLKRGEPVIFFNRTIHSSEDNKIYNQRPAISIKLTTKDATIISYHVVDWDKRLVNLYYQDDEYYVQEGWNESIKPTMGKFYKQIKLDLK